MAGRSGNKKQTGGEKQIGNKNARRGRDTFTYPNGDKYEGDWLAIYPDIFVRDGKFNQQYTYYYSIKSLRRNHQPDNI